MVNEKKKYSNTSKRHVQVTSPLHTTLSENFLEKTHGRSENKPTKSKLYLNLLQHMRYFLCDAQCLEAKLDLTGDQAASKDCFTNEGKY